MALRHHPIAIKLFSGLAFVLLLNLIFLYYSIGDNLWIFYNSDSLYLPYLYQDLIMRDGKLSEWIFSPTPYFFPDMLIYFILASITQHLRLAILLYAIVQFILYYWLIVAIAKKIIKNKTDISLLHLSVFISLLLLARGYLQQETLIMGLISQSHFGTALMFLLGLLLILNTFSSNNPWNYVFLFIVCFLTVFSDVLYLTQFFVPAIMSLCFMIFLSNHHREKTTYLKNIFVICFSCMSSYIIYKSKILPINLDNYTAHLLRIHLFELIAAAKKIIYNLSVFYYFNTITLIFLGLFIALTLYYFIKEPFKKPGYIESNKHFIFTINFLFASIIAGILSLLFFDNNLMAPNYINLRHCIPYMIFPVFLGVPLFLIMYTRLADIISTYYIYIIILMLSCAYLFPPKGSISNIINFYPESTACLDFYADKYHLKNGVSYFFWETRSNNFLSKKNLNIVNIDIDLSAGPIPRLYFNTLHDFKNKDFNFIVIGSEHESDPFLASNIHQFKNKFGMPSFEFTCPSWDDKKNTVLVYQTGLLNKDWNDALYDNLLIKKHLKIV
jgi:hypothetical protein